MGSPLNRDSADYQRIRVCLELQNQCRTCIRRSQVVQDELRRTLSISKWHPGKLIILWSWGALLAALALTTFLATPVDRSPLVHLGAFLVAILILILLSSLTWKWLSGREK